jgi:hypothetical protein
MNPTQFEVQYKSREESQLFLIRLWTERGNTGSEGDKGNDGDEASAVKGSGCHVEWCGRLQHVVSGEAQYFRGLPTLIDLLLQMTHTGEANPLSTEPQA